MGSLLARLPKTEKCCCCIELKAGSILVAVLWFISAVTIGGGSALYMPCQPKPDGSGKLYVDIMFYVNYLLCIAVIVGAVTALVYLFGVWKDYVEPAIIFTYALIIHTVTCVFLLFLHIAGFLVADCAFGLWLLIVSSFGILLNFYFLIIINSYRLKISTNDS